MNHFQTKPSSKDLSCSSHRAGLEAIQVLASIGRDLSEGKLTTAHCSNRAVLLNLLLESYDDLKSRLTRRLGSRDLAEDAIQDTFLRLSAAAVVGPLNSPRAYLFRIAMNVAARQMSERRRLTISDEGITLQLEDSAPSPARIVEARSEFKAFERAMNELPTRRREILIAARLDEILNQRIAQSRGVTVRTIQFELRQALAHCANRLNRDISKNNKSRSRVLSNQGSSQAQSCKHASDCDGNAF